MDVIELSGGIGNQMFQYALYKAFETKNIDVLIDTSFYESEQSLREIKINFFPNVKFQKIEEKKANLLRGYGYHDNILNKIYYKVYKNKSNLYEEKIDLGYQPEIFAMQNTYLSGYWQSELYFANISEKIRKDFIFSQIIQTDQYKKYWNQVRTTESVSIHIRRGDYLQEQLQKIYGNICTVEYYKNAIAYIRSKLVQPIFFVFSDDITWAEQNIYEPGMILIDSKGKWDEVSDLNLMHECKHHIIANSSFSWWGAWLGIEKNRIVLSPSKWFNNHTQTDMICKSWIRI